MGSLQEMGSLKNQKIFRESIAFMLPSHDNNFSFPPKAFFGWTWEESIYGGINWFFHWQFILDKMDLSNRFQFCRRILFQ